MEEDGSEFQQEDLGFDWRGAIAESDESARPSEFSIVERPDLFDSYTAKSDSFTRGDGGVHLLAVAVAQGEDEDAES